MRVNIFVLSNPDELLDRNSYSVFRRFGQVKFVNIVSILSTSQISLLPQLHQKMKLVSKVVKTDTKIIILLPKIYIRETHCIYQIINKTVH
jgi:hypothetical protein